MVKRCPICGVELVRNNLCPNHGAIVFEEPKENEDEEEEKVGYVG